MYLIDLKESFSSTHPLTATALYDLIQEVLQADPSDIPLLLLIVSRLFDEKVKHLRGCAADGIFLI